MRNQAVVKLHELMMETLGVDHQFELTHGGNSHLLAKGTIYAMFHKSRKEPFSGPLALPQNHIQCIHVERTYLKDGGVEFVKCMELSERGWLCRAHADKVFKRGKYRDVDQEIIDFVKATETKALAGSEREIHSFYTPKKTTIQYVKGLRMKNPPDTLPHDRIWEDSFGLVD